MPQKVQITLFRPSSPVPTFLPPRTGLQAQGEFQTQEISIHDALQEATWILKTFLV